MFSSNQTIYVRIILRNYELLFYHVLYSTLNQKTLSLDFTLKLNLPVLNEFLQSALLVH